VELLMGFRGGVDDMTVSMLTILATLHALTAHCTTQKLKQQGACEQLKALDASSDGLLQDVSASTGAMIITGVRGTRGSRTDSKSHSVYGHPLTS